MSPSPAVRNKNLGAATTLLTSRTWFAVCQALHANIRGEGGATVGLFKRKKQVQVAPASAEHAVIIHYALSDDQHGTVEDREAIFELEDRLATLMESQNLGEHDGNEFGGGEAVIYCYGPDADRLFAGIESDLRALPARPAYVYLRFGDVSDVAAREQRIDL